MDGSLKNEIWICAILCLLLTLGYAFFPTSGLFEYGWSILLTLGLSILLWRGKKAGFVAGILLAALVFALRQEKILGFLVGSFLPALALGWGLRSKKSSAVTISLALVPNLAILVLVAIHYPEIVYVLKCGLREIIEKINGQARLWGIGLALKGSKAFFLIDFLAALIFGLELLSGLARIYLVYLLVQLIGVRVGWVMVKIGPFHLWRGNQILAWCLVLGLVLLLVGGNLFEMISKNVLLVLGFCYCVLGFSVAEGLFRKSNLGLWPKISFHVLVFLMQVFSFTLLSFLGFFDSWMDFRGLSRKRATK